jgi:chemotaxis protein methyltransferase CheR
MAALDTASPQGGGREFAFTGEDFRTIAAVLHGDAGIYLPDSKATLVYSRLAKRLRVLGLSSFREYCALIQGQNGVDERQAMLAALTTNVTRFFREPHHFEDLRAKVMPALAAKARGGGRVRLWSAGCSTGPEPYSMALTLLSALPDAARHDIKILATDIDPNVALASTAARPWRRFRRPTASTCCATPAPATTCGGCRMRSWI